MFKKPFKVGLISYYYPEGSKFENGVAIHVYYLSKELAKLGCDVHVFASGDKSFIKKQYVGEGRITIHRISSKFDCPIDDIIIKKRMNYLIFDNKIINEVTKENAKGKFEIIHTHGWLTAGAFISKIFNNIKWVHTFHALEKNRVGFMSKAEKKFFGIAKWIESTIKYANALVAVSHNLEREILQNYPIKKEKVHYIPNGVDLSLFKVENVMTNEKKVLYVGRFSLEKGIDLVQKIALEVLSKNKEVKFVVLATGTISPSIEKVKKEFDTLKEIFGDRFALLRESISREELAELYNESSIVIQPSRYEAFGLCVLEAMACGDAVIVSNKGGLSEVVGNAGIILPTNSQLFSKEILKLLDNYRLRERYGRRGVERARKFSWIYVAKKTLELYRKISEKAK